ncbi:dihydrodipicolinate synthase family protein [Sphingosinicellaceae bacterium]|nr:dihydrodipicolinate synthase family protein [Sphingosinicellaceae bacterium]
MTSKRSRTDWRGYIPAMLTPFAADGALDLPTLARHLEWLHGEGMHGLVIGGTTGEWTSLSPVERRQLFTAVGAQMKGRLPLLAGCTSYTPDEAVALAEHAAAASFDGILLTPPPYLKPTEEEIFRFYEAVAARSPLPLCVYNWPPGTGIDMSLELLTRIAAIDNVAAIKQSTGVLSRFVATFFALREQVRVFGFSMDEHGLTLLRVHDGDGTMGAGGVLGRDQPDFYNNLWRGDIDAARACGAKDRLILDLWYTPDLVGRFGSGPAALKAGFAALGMSLGGVRAPLIDVDDAGRQRIAETLRAVGKL